MDAVIVPHVGTSLDTYRALLRHEGELRVGVWGHIRSYVNHPNVLDRSLERWQLRVADHIFAYTQGGAEYALAQGADASRITTVMNTIQTDVLVSAREALRDHEVAGFRNQTGLPRDAILFAYIGGLDRSKRIHFLAQVLERLWVQDKRIRVLVAGSGDQEHLLAPGMQRGQIIRVGYADPQIKARIAAVSRAFLNPGRVGLIAVDALVLGRPILTTAWPYHAPELEYLVEGRSVFTTADAVDQQVDKVLELAAGPVREQEHFKFPRMDQMVSRFSLGVRRLLA